MTSEWQQRCLDTLCCAQHEQCSCVLPSTNSVLAEKTVNNSLKGTVQVMDSVVPCSALLCFAAATVLHPQEPRPWTPGCTYPPPADTQPSGWQRRLAGHQGRGQTATQPQAIRCLQLPQCRTTAGPDFLGGALNRPAVPHACGGAAAPQDNDSPQPCGAGIHQEQGQYRYAPGE